MENTNNQHDMDEEFEDSLSLCDLPLHQENETNTFLDQDQGLSNLPSSQDSFEFSLNTNSKTDPTSNDIIFCGKTMSYKMEESPDDLYHERNSLFPLSSAKLPSKNNRSNSFHVQTSKSSMRPRATGSFHYQSGDSRKHKFMIGLARIPPKMELTDIRKRQSRQVPVPMFPAKVHGDEAPVSICNEGGKKDHRGPLRPLKCRSYLARWLTRAYLGCMHAPCVTSRL